MNFKSRWKVDGKLIGVYVFTPTCSLKKIQIDMY